MRTKFMVLGSVILGAFLFSNKALHVMADTKSSAPTDFVDAPKPTRLLTHDYVTEPVSDESRRGESIYNEANCVQCHSIKNAGGNLGPMLDGIGYRRPAEFLYARLCNSREAKETYFKLTGQNASAYIHPRLSRESATALVSFLMTIPEPEGGFVLTPHVMSLPAAKRQINSTFKPMAQNKSSMAGEKLFNNKGCIACHTVNNVGGWMGPNLDGVGGRLDRSSIIKNISNPARVSKEVAGDIDVLPQMPKLNLSDEEISKLADYLLTLPNSAVKE